MGFASSSAVRVDEAYGSLGGAFGGMGGERKLKKKPVLVLDPEELAKAHQLFQIGAAEQIGEYDPLARASRPSPPVFGTILGGAAIADDDDDYVAPLDLGDEEEEPEDDLPPIDLDALLALSSAEQEEEDAFYRGAAAAEPEFADEFLGEAEPELPAAPIAEAPIAPSDAPSPADALARIISRVAAQPAIDPEPLDEQPEQVLPVEDLSDAVAESVPEAAAEEAYLTGPEPLETETFDAESRESEAEPAAEGEPLELLPHEEFDGEAFVMPEAPLRVLPIIGEEGTRSTLRARLVREDMTLAHPETGKWRKLVIAVRRWWQSF